MVCPVCKIDTKVVWEPSKDGDGGRYVLICKNPQCPRYKKVIKEVSKDEG